MKILKFSIFGFIALLSGCAIQPVETSQEALRSAPEATLLEKATDMSLELFSTSKKSQTALEECQRMQTELQKQQTRALDEQRRADEASRRAESEQKRAEGELRRSEYLTERLRQAEARVIELQAKLDALKGIEKSLNERGNHGGGTVRSPAARKE